VVSLPLPLLRLLPGGTNQFPGGTCTPCGLTPFTAHADHASSYKTGSIRERGEESSNFRIATIRELLNPSSPTHCEIAPCV